MKPVHNALLFQRIGLGVLNFLARSQASLTTPMAAAGRRGRPGHVILVTSAREGEGKTFVAQGLAAALADQQEGDVIWVDAAFDRSPAQAGDSNRSVAGFSEIMTLGSVQAIGSKDVGPDRLWRIGGGTLAQPALLRHPEAVRKGLAALRARFALTVVDAPPLARCGELLVQSDASVVVVDSRRTSGRQAQRALQDARLGPATLAGVVLNHLPRPTPQWLGGERV